MKKRLAPIRYAMSMFAAIGSFFLLMYLTGFGHIVELRLVNVLIVIYFTGKMAADYAIARDKAGYLNHLIALFSANIINVVLCILGILLFVLLIDPSYPTIFENGLALFRVSSLSELIISLAMEGMAVGAVTSFGVMQYWKNYKVDYKNTD